MSDVSNAELKREIENEASWGEEEKRLRAIRDGRKAKLQCIMCGKPLGFWDKYAKRTVHTKCENFIE